MRSRIRWVAVALAVVAIGYYIWHGLTYTGDDPFDIGGGWVGPQLALPIVAVTVLPMVFAFTGEGLLQALTGRNSGEFRQAPVGLGTIRSFRQTGLTVNDQPQVRIELSVEGADGETFDAHAKMIVPLTEISLLQPGVVLPVRYRPDHRDRVEIDLSGDRAAAQQAMNAAMIGKGFTTPAKLDIAARGVAAQAVVRELAVPGEIRDGHTKVELELAVTRPDGTIFATRVNKFLSPTAIGQVQVGRIVQVRYLPGDEQEVVLVLAVNA
ncbi:hypothetical protein D5S18_11585 [Nocardia panacis]|uniref:Uncharacterized protein n=1 Tax=Nocardia panacis TaxID=2340916 RepID=A0A3A4JZI1_9NOCA|nr:hypothetical protein [Nocardia panacis]RJO76855.1 hypothetical protein D5S18_11585 [Nocardia panacis]